MTTPIEVGTLWSIWNKAKQCLGFLRRRFEKYAALEARVTALEAVLARCPEPARALERPAGDRRGEGERAAHVAQHLALGDALDLTEFAAGDLALEVVQVRGPDAGAVGRQVRRMLARYLLPSCTACALRI